MVKSSPIAESATKPQRAPTPFEERLHKVSWDGDTLPCCGARCYHWMFCHCREFAQVCSAIPKGKVSTYGALSQVLKSSPRAVGQALRRNPFAPQVPCHRVIASTLELGGFSGTWVGAHPSQPELTWGCCSTLGACQKVPWDFEPSGGSNFPKPKGIIICCRVCSRLRLLGRGPCWWRRECALKVSGSSPPA